MESLYKIGAKKSASNKEGKYNYLILDEFSSLCRQFFSTTMDENRYLNVIMFERLIMNTPKLKKTSPCLLLMPLWLKNLYICELQEIHRSKRKLNNEVDRLLAKEH